MEAVFPGLCGTLLKLFVNGKNTEEVKRFLFLGVNGWDDTEKNPLAADSQKA